MQNCTVVAIVFVIASTKHSYEHVIMHDVEAKTSLFGLVAGHDEVQVIPGAKLCCHIPTKFATSLTAWRSVDSKDFFHVRVVILDRIPM